MKKATLEKIKNLAKAGNYYKAAVVCPAHGDVGHPLTQFEPRPELITLATAMAAELGWNAGGAYLQLGPVHVSGHAGSPSHRWTYMV